MAHQALSLILLFGGCCLLHTIFAQRHPHDGGVRPPSSDDVELANRLWENICKNHDGSYKESGKDGDDYVFCAYFDNLEPITVTHKPMQLKAARASKGNEYIVIDPPYHKYTHKIKLTGSRAAGPKTTIFVRPPKNRHVLELQDDTSSNSKPSKPTVVYLKPEKVQDSSGATTEHPGPVPARFQFDHYDGLDSNLSPVEEEPEEEAESAPLPIITRGTSAEVPETVNNVGQNVQSDSGDEHQAKFTPGVFKLGSGARMQYTI